MNNVQGALFSSEYCPGGQYSPGGDSILRGGTIFTGGHYSLRHRPDQRVYIDLWLRQRTTTKG